MTPPGAFMVNRRPPWSKGAGWSTGCLLIAIIGKRYATREDLTLEHLSGLMPAKVRHSDYTLTWLASRWNPSKCSHNLTAPSRAPPLWMEARARLPLRITERAIDVRTHSQIIYCDVFPSRSSSHDSTSRIISFRTSGMLIWCPLATITYLLFAAVAPQR
jgi:hypothetical protein